MPRFIAGLFICIELMTNLLASTRVNPKNGTGITQLNLSKSTGFHYFCQCSIRIPSGVEKLFSL